jgi:hypothetical protein
MGNRDDNIGIFALLQYWNGRRHIFLKNISIVNILVSFYTPSVISSLQATKVGILKKKTLFRLFFKKIIVFLLEKDMSA